MSNVAIRARREALKLTQKTAAQLAGVTWPTWQRFETGGYPIAPYLAARCMRLLNGEIKIPKDTPRKRTPAECAALAKNLHEGGSADGWQEGRRGSRSRAEPHGRPRAQGRHSETTKGESMSQSTERYFFITMFDGSEWAVPVGVIAAHRTLTMGTGEIGEASTTELFEDDEQIADWAQNNMGWDEVKAHAKQVKEPQPPNYEDGWVNGAWEVGEWK